ncbi:MAG: GNAT family N-acetyltransferase [Candidatus Sumerlaeota bacterium]|nr:GNAT family N-acetyltransferase [Candidatus Sumerlaeota bacterium]
MNASIKSFSIEHYDRVAELWRRSEGIGLDDDVDSREGILRYLDRNPGMSFVAEEGARIVGAVLCGHDGRRGYLHHLAVDPAYRRGGLGRALVERCLAALREAGISRCNIFVFDDNEEGLAFWERTGWELRENLHLMSTSTWEKTHGEGFQEGGRAAARE